MIAKIINVTLVIVLLISTGILGFKYFTTKDKLTASKTTLQELERGIKDSRRTLGELEHENNELRDLNRRTKKELEGLREYSETLEDSINRGRLESDGLGEAIDRSIEIVNDMENN